MKKIAILTSGGDAPGMNAAIRAVVRQALYEKMEVMGIERGYFGLINDQMFPMDMGSVSDIIQRGGTILKTARCQEFITEEGQLKAVATLKKRGIEGLIVVGGNGTFAGAKDLTDRGIPAIGIPGTIDNDLAYTEYSLGFDTAVNTALDAINKIRDTMSSHERVSIIEVMGRHCGDIALYAGITGGAEVIIVPEHKLGMDEIINLLTKSRRLGKKSGIVVLAEGAGHAGDYEKELTARTDLSVRATVLGHILRGGSPTMFDRLLGTRCGVHAVALLKAGIGGRIVGLKNNKIYDIDIIEGLAIEKKFDLALYKTATIISR
jgi:6-phosphofructokinase 1